MESETFLLWLAKVCQVGGSFGLRASDLAERIILQEPSMMLLPADVMGSWATRACNKNLNLLNNGLKLLNNLA